MNNIHVYGVRYASSLTIGPGNEVNSCGQCVLCVQHLSNSTIYESSVTGKRFEFQDSHKINLACHTKNLIYLITCKVCSIQYIGKTEVTIKQRFYNHRHNCLNDKSQSILYKHFRENHHQISDYVVQIIHVVDDKDKGDIEMIEEYFMRLLCTFYPYGLNDKINGSNIILTQYDFSKFNVANTPFFTNILQSNRIRHFHGRRKRNKIDMNLEFVLDYISHIERLYNNYSMYTIYTAFRSISKKLMTKCIHILFINKSKYSEALLKLFLAFYSRFVKINKTQKKPRVFCIIPYLHKIIEKIKFKECLNNKDIKNLLPLATKNIFINIGYRYGFNIGASIFNYNKVLKSDNCVDKVFSQPCDCATKFSKFVYGPHGHVHTGNLQIVENLELRNLMSKGAKFREMPKCNKSQLFDNFVSVINYLKIKIAKCAKIKTCLLSRWQEAMITLIKSKITKLSNNDMQSNAILKKDNIKKYIQYLHSRFVIVPIDKASNNFAIICKQFYVKTLMSELGIDNNVVKGNDVYKYINVSPEQLFEIHSLTLDKQFNIVLDDKNKNIPVLYWTSKQHKNPYKFRFIAGACKCTNKQISIEVSLALKCIKTHFRNYCNVIKRRSGISHYWSIDNSLEFIDKLSGVKKAYSIETFDFSTLYTNLPLQEIYCGLELLIIKMFNKNVSNTILVNAYKKKAFWSDNSSYPGCVVYTVDKLLEALKFVIFETYIKFDKYVFKQIKGIPMGGNASPLIADLYLSWCEFLYVSRLCKTNIQMAKNLYFTSRYLDDIVTVNFDSFLNISKDIYHNSLVLDSNDHDKSWDTFLDLFIRIIHKHFLIGIYHKVDDFNFEVVNFPFPESNIHSSVGYKVFYGQLIRFFRICNNQHDFLTRCIFVYNKLLARGFKHEGLYKYFRKFTITYNIFLKYGIKNHKDFPNL